MDSPKILIVEDEEPLRAILLNKFALAGFHALEAATGESALEIAAKERPDIIMTDIVMFPMDGITFIKKLRSSGVWGSKVPCYVFSNQHEPELIQQLKTIGISEYFIKSETPIDRVIEAIKSKLS